MEFKVDLVQQHEFPAIVDVWEASVRATHHFLNEEEDIAYFKPLILNEYLKAVDLRCVRDSAKNIIGFLGVARQNIEMLFIHPNVRSKGIGKTLTEYAIKVLHCIKVDVNEDNEQALGFYQNMGFKIIGRSELDGNGKPYPILHMQLL